VAGHVFQRDRLRNPSLVQRSAGTFTVLATTGVNVTRYVDGGLSASTQYCYRIAAFKTKGDSRDYSDPSGPACATTFQPPAPTAPSNTRAAAIPDSQIDVAVGSAASPECSG
jgi:hypothetical protein